MGKAGFWEGCRIMQYPVVVLKENRETRTWHPIHLHKCLKTGIYHAFGPKSSRCCINFSPPPSLTTAYTRKTKQKNSKEWKE